MEKNTFQPKVLFVEDDPLARKLMARTLSDLQCTYCDEIDGPSALHALMKSDFAVALIDLNLPGMDGFELAQNIRKMKQNSDLPLIFLTGGTLDASLVEKAYQLGAVDFLNKDIPTQLVRAKVAVFVELATKRHTVVRRERDLQRVALEQEQQRINLEQRESSLARMRELSSEGARTHVARILTGSGPVKQRDLGAFRKMVGGYQAILDAYLDQLVTTADKPQDEMAKLVRRLGDLGATPRDLLDVHIEALQNVSTGVNPRRAQSYSVEGRLLALEMMGLLVDYYRTGARWRSPRTG